MDWMKTKIPEDDCFEIITGINKKETKKSKPGQLANSLTICAYVIYIKTKQRCFKNAICQLTAL